MHRAAARRLAHTAARSTKRASAATVHQANAHVPLSVAKPPPPPPHGPQATPDQWAVLQPAPPAAFAALAHRIQLANKLPLKALQQACTHPSILPVFARWPSLEKPSSNGNLAALGNSLLGMFVTEHLNARYPHLPLKALKAAVSAYAGPLTCATVAKEMGVTHLVRWHRTPATSSAPAVMHQDALASIPRALLALVYTHVSLPAAREFAQSFFLSRTVDLRALLKFSDPKLQLIETVAKLHRERPVSRLLAETGRNSNSPVYVVGVYSGADKLGEGFGSSLRMAEYRAAEDALQRFYLTETPSEELRVPSETFLPGDLFLRGAAGEERRHNPIALGETEVRYDAGPVSNARPLPPPPEWMIKKMERGLAGGAKSRAQTHA
ncbi:unnamed protein product [Peniophora sp. CBMAI 1063]|nr:unnamed protein product [Peniophora sp. CBMAI 1063]